MATARKVYLFGDPMTGEFGTPATATVTVPYMVEFTDQSALPGEAAVANAGGGGAVPPYGHLMGAMTLQRKLPRQVDKDPSRYVVNCVYALPIPNTSPAPASPSNDRWNVQIDITTRRYEEEAFSDISGNQLVNSAGDSLYGIMVPRSDEEIVISFTTDSPNWTDLDLAFGPLGRGCVNSEAVTMTLNGTSRTFAIGTLHFEDYAAATTVDVSGVSYTRMTFRLAWRQEGWKRKIIDKGLNKLGTMTLADLPPYPLIYVGPVPIEQAVHDFNRTTSHMESIVNPQYLDGTGQPLVLGDPVVILPASGVHAHEGFELFEQAELVSILLWELNT